MHSWSQVPTLTEIKNHFDDLSAIIFDMDGTLLNSEILHAKALAYLLGDNSNQRAFALLEEFKGVAEPDVLVSLKSKGIVKPHVVMDEFIIEKNKHFHTMMNDTAVMQLLVKAEILSLLSEIKKHQLKLALVTASERTTTDLFLRSLNLSHFFDIIITREDTEKTKPDPMPYHHCFNQLQLNPKTTLIFEDSPTGLASAMNSGAHVVKVTWYENY
jgi:HAD superfamily hydrolase (TIGR01509 family)